MMPPLLRSLRLRNFKALRDSGAIKLGALTVLIGNNGSGKSSVLEGLETLCTFVTRDLDAAMQLWHGIEHVRNKVRRRMHRHDAQGKERSSKPISFQLSGVCGQSSRHPFSLDVAINERGDENELFIEREQLRWGQVSLERASGMLARKKIADGGKFVPSLSPQESLLNSSEFGAYCSRWQFLRLTAESMGEPTPQTRTRGRIQLAKNGANIAEYLLHLREKDRNTFEGIIDTLRYVLPYASDMQPAITSELERTVYLQMSERDFKVPGWLLSTGTLRILSLLAVLRHPEPPPFIIIEEIENGLDPRTIHLLVDELHNAVNSKRCQILLTTHSPYLMDLLPLSCLVLCERAKGEPKFRRPASDQQIKEWSKTFSPGQLYTSSRMKRKVRDQ